MKAALVFSLIVSLVPPANQKHNGEDEKEATERYAVIADAIAERAGDDDRLARFMLAVARHESTFARDVHAGDKRGDGGLAWGLFQINIGSRRESQKIPRTDYTLGDIVGTDIESTRRAVDAVVMWLRPAINRCHGAPRCVFIHYGGITKAAAEEPDVSKRLDERVATYRQLAKK